jgi:osmotically-inducible protein OsmY
MGERDRNQSYAGRHEADYDQRDDSSYRGQNQREARDRDDYQGYRHFQGRDQSHLGREYNTDRNLSASRYDEQHRHQEERERNARYGYEAQRLPNIYGSYDERLDRERDWDRSRVSAYEQTRAQEERQRAQAGGNYAGYGWNRGSTLQGGYASQPQRDWGDRGYGQPQRDWGDRGYSQGNYDRGYYGERNFSQRDWGNRAYGEGDRGYGQSQSQHGREESWGQQLREAGHQVAQKVKRVFRGPKGYKRSDERIREDLSDRLAQQDHLDPSDIEVTVSNGEVTLSGTVENRNEKFLAEEIADDVSGVNDVHNQLRIRREQPTSLSGANAENANATHQNTNDPVRNRNARA